MCPSLSTSVPSTIYQDYFGGGRKLYETCVLMGKQCLLFGRSLSVPCLLAPLPWSLSQPVSQGPPGPCLPFTDMAFAPLRRM